MRSNYKTLLSEKRFLKVQLRARQLYNSDLRAIKYSENRLVFHTKSGTDRRTIWVQTLEIEDLDLDKIRPLKHREIEDLIKNANIKLHCTCPAFRYWGFEYIAWRYGYGLVKQTIKPSVRNPRQIGYVCFPAGEMVWTSEGYRPIENIKVGDLVFTHDGTLKPVTSTRVTNHSKMISVRVGRNTWINSTDNHKHYAVPKLVKTNNAKNQKIDQLNWYEVGKLKTGDFLVSTMLNLPEEIIMDCNKAWLLGLYLADGTAVYKKRNESDSFRKNNLNFYAIKIAFDTRMQNLYQDEFKRRGIKIDRITHIEGTNSSTLYIRDYNIIKFCIEYGNYTSSKYEQCKKLDNNCIRWNKEAKKELLSGFFVGDGTLVESGSNKVYLTWFNTNKQIMDILHILISEYAQIDLNSYNRKPFKLNDRLYQPKVMYYFRLTGAAAKRFAEKNSMLQFKGQYKEELNWSDYKNFEFDRKCLRQIKEHKTYNENTAVYSIEVGENHSYIVNGIITKNCKHLYNVLQMYPFWAKALASKYKNRVEGKMPGMKLQSKERFFRQ